MNGTGIKENAGVVQPSTDEALREAGANVALMEAIVSLLQVDQEVQADEAGK